MLSKISSPAIIAHRGASHYAPENTLAAFAKAVEFDADGIELDVMLTRDREVVVIHDGSVDRTTNGHGRVAEMTLTEIQALKAGSSLGAEFEDQTVPTLDQVLTLFAVTIPINIELKNYATPWDDLPVRVAQLVRKHRCRDQILFSSFNPLALIKARRQLPEVPAGFLVAKGMLGSPIIRILRRLISHQAVHPHYTDVTAEQVRQAHTYNRRVNTYTVNQKETMTDLFDIGIDSIFTDDPVLGLEARAAWRSSNP